MRETIVPETRSRRWSSTRNAPVKLIRKCLGMLCAVTAFTFSTASPALVNPESIRDSAPIIIDCRVLEAFTIRVAGTEAAKLRCRIDNVERSPVDLEKERTIAIQWLVNRAEIERRWAEMEKKAGEGWAGASPVSAPRLPEEGSRVRAYLRLRGNDSPLSFEPAIGFMSFESLEAPDSAHCAETGNGPIHSAEVACARALLDILEKDVEQMIVTELTSIQALMNIKDDNEAVRLANREMAAMLTRLRNEWRDQRDDFCELAYYRAYPGSMARYRQLSCQIDYVRHLLAQLSSTLSLP